MELSMYITTYRDRRINLDHIGFFDEQLPCFVANFTDLVFRDDFASAKSRDGPGETVSAGNM